ncbi:MAG: hypothetical protein IJN29_05120 [Akkermansia sp.]|nr:hypothetical protein [Akkermansia sp.]
MKTLDVKRPAADFCPLTHPILWWRNHSNKLNERRMLFSKPYTIQLPILPSCLYFCWQEKALLHESLFMENRTLRYHDEKNRFFWASLEVDRWQGVFCLNEPTEKEMQPPITDMEFWGLALREHGNTEEELSYSMAQGAVFWHDNVLHVYPAQIGAAFESFLQECLLPETSE